MNIKKFALPLTALICCGVSFFWYTSVTGTANSQTESLTEQTLARPIPTTFAEANVSHEARMFPGSVQAKKSANLAFSQDGLLIELNGREGRMVQKGELLAKIDQRDFQNNYDAAKANYEQAKADFRRTTSLMERNVISQAEYDLAKTNHDVAKAQLNIQKKALDDTLLVAPYDAVVATRFVENNEHIKAQTPIIAIRDISEIEVVVQVPERLMALGAIGDFKDIWVNFDADKNRWFPGDIKEYSVQSDPMTRTYDVTVRVESPHGLEILPGMTATVRTLLKGAEELSMVGNSTIIPNQAVFAGSDGTSYAWIIPEESGKPVKQAVVLGALSDKGVVVLDGLEPGTRIATAGIHKLSEEMLVRPMKKGEEGLDG